MLRTILPLAVCSICFMSASVVTADALSVDVEFSASEAGEVKAFEGSLARGEDGAVLKEASRQLMAASTAAMEMQRRRDDRRIVLESSHFARRDGKVRGVGIFWDGKGPRPLQMYVDAWGQAGTVVATYSYNFTSTGNRQKLETTGIDNPAYVKFSFRFTDGNDRLEISAIPAEDLDVVPVSPSAMLFHKDYGEVRALLAALGESSPNSFEPVALFGEVKRFRQQHRIDGPAFITLLDLFALRAAAGAENAETSLLPYIDWASSLGGGRAVERPTYQPVSFEDGYAYLLED